MSEIPASYSILPDFVTDALAGDLLETHRLALRSLDLLAELRERVNEIKWFGARNLIAQEESRRRFLAATIELHEIWDTYTTVEVYEHVARALINASRSKESIKYEDNLGECFHELVLRMVGMNLNALFMLPFPLHWKSDREELMEWLAVDASRQFESQKFRFGVGGKDGWWLHSELRREAIGATSDTGERRGQQSGQTQNLLPANPDVLKLAKKIKKERDVVPSLIAIARDFANGDEKRAKSLLRQLRRFPHLRD